MQRRRFIHGAGASGIALGLAGCTGGGGGGDGGDGGDGDGDGGSGADGGDGGGGDMDGGGGEATPTEQPMMTTKLAMAHYPILTVFAPVVAAREQGLWEKHGLTVEEIISFSGGGTTTRGLTTGGIGLGGSALAAAVKAWNVGAPVSIIGLFLSSSDIEFQVKPDSPLETIQDLAGERVAVTNPGSSTEAVLIQAIQNAEGITLEDIEIVHAGGLGEALTAFGEGNVACTMNIQPVALQYLNSGKARRLFFARDYATNYTQFTLAATHDLMENNLEKVKAYIRGIIDSFEYTKANPDPAARAWADVADVDPDLAVESLQITDPEVMFNVPPKKSILEGTAATMIEQGIIDEQPPWEQIVDQRALPEDKRVEI